MKAAGAALVVAALAFGCNKGKPEPEKNCVEKGNLVVCPGPIAAVQKEVDCVEKGGSIRMRDGRSFKPGSTVSGVKAEASRMPDAMLYDIELSIPSGNFGAYQFIRGHAKAMDCAAK